MKLTWESQSPGWLAHGKSHDYLIVREQGLLLACWQRSAAEQAGTVDLAKLILRGMRAIPAGNIEAARIAAQEQEDYLSDSAENVPVH